MEMYLRLNGRYSRRPSDVPEVKIFRSSVSLARGIWLNMSQGGMLISIPSFADRLPSSFEVSFRLPGSQKVIRAMVRLVWFKTSLKNILAGVEFLEADGVFQSTISRALLKLKISDMLVKRGITAEHIFWFFSIGLLFLLIIKKNL